MEESPGSEAMGGGLVKRGTRVVIMALQFIFTKDSVPSMTFKCFTFIVYLNPPNV